MEFPWRDIPGKFKLQLPGLRYLYCIYYEVRNFRITYFKRKIAALAFLAAMVWSSFSARAGHLVGGEIYYEYLGNNQYLLTMVIYRDCNSGAALFDSPAYVGIFDAQGQSVQVLQMFNPVVTNIPPVVNNPCLQSPPNVCVEEGVYQEIVTLPNIPGGYTVAYQRCCRNVTINNIVNPSDQGGTYFTNIPGGPLYGNSSPYFTDFPPIVLCVGDTLVFDHGAIDPDSDSIVYEFTDPYHGASFFDPQPLGPAAPPYATVPFSAPYSAGYAIPSNPDFSIDPQTGLLVGVPTQAGQYVMCITAKEYRNGVLIGETRRDFQFNCTNCISNTLAGIQPQTSYCDDLTLSFINQSQIAQYYSWDFGVPNDPADTSSVANPTFTFPDTGTYTVTLIANPGWPCADTTTRDFALYYEPQPQFSAGPAQCITGNSFNFSALTTHGTNAQYSWDFGNGTSANLANPTGVQFAQAGVFPVTLSVQENGCTGTFTDSVRIYEAPQFNLDFDPVVGCSPLQVSGNMLSNYPNSDFQVTWQLSNGLSFTGSNISEQLATPGIYDLSVQVQTTAGCLESFNFDVPDAITVLPTPTAGFGLSANVVSIFDAQIDVSSSAIGADSVFFYMGDGSVYTVSSFSHTYTWDEEFQVMQIVTNTDGCADTAFRTIEVESDYIPYIPNAFTPDGNGTNEGFRPVVLGAEEYAFYVFNRWGEQLFFTTDRQQGWDGTHKGVASPTGVYLYRIDIITKKGRRERATGTFTLIR